MGCGMVAGMVKVVRSCWLLPLLMLELPILLVSISLSLIPLSRITLAGSSQWSS